MYLKKMNEIKTKPNKSERILRVAFIMLVIACILLLGAWLAKLVLIAVR